MCPIWSDSAKNNSTVFKIGELLHFHPQRELRDEAGIGVKIIKPKATGP